MKTTKSPEIQGNQIRFLSSNSKYEVILDKMIVHKFALIESVNYDDSVLRINENIFYAVDKNIGKIVYDFLAAKPKVKAYHVFICHPIVGSHIIFVKPEDFEYFVDTFTKDTLYRISILKTIEIEESQCWTRPR